MPFRLDTERFMWYTYSRGITYEGKIRLIIY